MNYDPTQETGCWISADHGVIFRKMDRRYSHHHSNRWRGRLTLRQLRGIEPIHLDVVESRILRFLASRPYQPFSRQRIAEAVSTERHPVTADAVDRYIHSLRGQLGFFHDYVQSVRYVGYQFRA